MAVNVLLFAAALGLSATTAKQWVRILENEDKEFTNSTTVNTQESSWQCGVLCEKEAALSFTHNVISKNCACYDKHHDKHCLNTEQLRNIYFVSPITSCDKAHNDGVYVYQLTFGSLIRYNVYCDVINPNDAWLVFQRRLDGTENFQRTFQEYVDGFGNKDGEFWMGNEFLHSITSHGKWHLRFDVTHKNLGHKFIIYDNFRIGDAVSKYQLTVGNKIDGTMDNLMYYHNGRKFSAKDQDNDDSSAHCSQNLQSAWWFRDCRYVDYNHPLEQGPAHCSATFNFNRGVCTSKIEMKIQAQK